MADYGTLTTKSPAVSMVCASAGAAPLGATQSGVRSVTTKTPPAYCGINVALQGTAWPTFNREIRGQVQVLNAPAAGMTVCLFDKRSKLLADQRVTDATGHFVFSLLPDQPRNYFVIAFDSTGSPAQNALIYDNVRAQLPT